MQIIRYTQRDSQPGMVGSTKEWSARSAARLSALTGAWKPISRWKQVTLLAPVEPSKVLAVGRNYPEHAREHDVEIPEIPLIFSKPSPQ